MTAKPNTILVTHDKGLLAHWQQVFGTQRQKLVHRMEDLFHFKPTADCVVWLDLAIAQCPPWEDPNWRSILQDEQVRVVAASSNPQDEEAMRALDAGCSAYCHAFSDAATLKQVKEVVDAGHVWIGKALMQRLLHGVNHVATARPTPDVTWQQTLTQREVEVATLAANGASNQAIAAQCNISERTVKAHLSAVFEKLNITDRLQLALRVHGIH